MEKMKASEVQFAKHLEDQGKIWVFEPLKFDLGNTTYTPDFYCPDNDTFYEVKKNKKSISTNAEKYKRIMIEFPWIKFKIVVPSGKALMEREVFLKYYESLSNLRKTYGIDPEKANIVKKLKKYREDNQLTYEDLAREMGFNFRNIYRWLKEGIAPSHLSMWVIKMFLEGK